MVGMEEERLKAAQENAKLREEKRREHDAVLRQRQARVNVKTALAAAFALAEEWVYTAQVFAEVGWEGVAESAAHDGRLEAESDVAEAIEALLTAGLSAVWKTEKAKDDWLKAVEKAMIVGAEWCTREPIAIHEKLKILIKAN